MKTKANPWMWPAMVLGLFVIQAIFMGAAIVLAHNDPSVAVEPDYYEKALRWDQDAARQRAALALGWEAALEIEPPTGAMGQRTLRVRIKDGEGNAVPDLAVTVEAFHQAESGARRSAEATPTPDGYIATIPMARAGHWEVRIRAGSGGAELQRTVFAEIPAEPAR